ncbi:MAG: hypothetical protein L0Z62_49705 [Gemmataceae bacterium]|nr:hypothetical protein [Gemmataceae bacterium]
MKESATSARRILATQRRLQALSLRRQGRSFRAIGKALGISGAGAFKLVRVGMTRHRDEHAEEIKLARLLDQLRVDALLEALWPLAVGSPPNLEAVDQVLKLMERLERLLGLLPAGRPRGRRRW